MSGRDDDRSEFERAMGDVRRAPPDRRRPEPVTPPARKTGDDRPADFTLRREGERIQGWADGVDARTRKRLARGEFPVEREIDLHGLEAAAARRALHSELAAARANGERCLLVIHGRGLRSEDGPRLKAALPDWLAEAPHGASVLAFSTAGPGRGGTGASYVLLRRAR